MFERLKSWIAEILVLPKGPPEMPADGHERVDVFRASPKFLAYQYLALGLALLAPTAGCAAVTIAASIEGLWGLWLVAALAWAVLAAGAFFAYFATRLEYELRYYVVTDRSLRIREGAIRVRELTLTYQNVQNVSLHQGPIERLLGIADVVVETAGGGGHSRPDGTPNAHQGVLRGIENADEVRELIRSCLAKAPAHSGLGDPDEPAARALGRGSHLELLKEIRDEAARFRAEAERLGANGERGELAAVRPPAAGK